MSRSWRYLIGMRENDEMWGRQPTCWALLHDGDNPIVCIKERGHDDGEHEAPEKIALAIARTFRQTAVAAVEIVEEFFSALGLSVKLR